MDVINLMLDNKFRKLPVVDKQNNIKGLIANVDILNTFGGGEKYRMFTLCRKSLSMKIRRVMEKHVRKLDKKTPIHKALEILKREGRGLYPVVERKKLKGLVSEWDFVKIIDNHIDLKVEDLMTKKPIVSEKDYTVFEVTKMICRGGFRRLPVVDNKILIGIVTPSDILKYLHENSKEKELVLDRTRIENIMNRNVITMKPEANLIDAIKIMKEKRIGGIPITEEEELVGILTERDIIDAFS
jgi:CBS domain-containing protein